jgi:hypothetical protein
LEFRGDRNQTGRVNIWQNGQHFTVISCWPKTEENLKAGIWSSYKGEGTFQGRRMVFKVLPSNREGRSADQGYVYYWTISEDNSRITVITHVMGKERRTSSSIITRLNERVMP